MEQACVSCQGHTIRGHNDVFLAAASHPTPPQWPGHAWRMSVGQATAPLWDDVLILGSSLNFISESSR